MEEIFGIVLFGLKGDVIIIYLIKINIRINVNDNLNGVFSFVLFNGVFYLEVKVSEDIGGMGVFFVQRYVGLFGIVLVIW